MPMKMTIEQYYPKEVNQALNLCGQYVYAYYEENSFQPFYVGKGTGNRAFSHWNAAINSPSKEHEIKINSILNSGQIPQVRLLAYNLEETNTGNNNETTYSIVERVLQDAFGIQNVVKKTIGGDRIEQVKASLLQTREDSAKHPMLSLDAAIAKYDIRPTITLEELKKRCEDKKMPILLVGLSKTYHPKYDSIQLAEMSRKYWNLEKFQHTSLPRFQMDNAILLAWASINRRPMIVGAWEIDSKNAIKNNHGRYEFNITNFSKHRKEFIGLRLAGTGNHWQGQRIYIPS